jgi:hypothetical protein
MDYPRRGFRRHPVVAVCALFLVAVVYLATLPTLHLRDDEELSYRTTSLDLGYAVWYTTYNDIHPPVWYAFFWVWRQMVGDSEFAGRVQAALFSLIALALVYRCGREWFRSPRVGIFAVIACGLSAYHVYYALEIRPYGLVMLLAALSMWLFGRWMQSGARRWALGWGAMTAAMGYVHYLLGFLSIIQVLYILVAARPLRRYLGQSALAASLGGLIIAPWIPRFMYQVELLRQITTEAGQAYGAGVGAFATAIRTTPEAAGQLLALATNGHWAVYAGLLIVGTVWAAQRIQRRRLYGLALLWGVGVPALVLTVNIAFGVYSQRYIAYLTLGLALAAAAGLVGVGDLWRRLKVGWAVVAIFAALNAATFSAYLPVRTPHRDIYRAMLPQVQAEDAVFIIGPTAYEPVARWQMQQYLTPPIYERSLAALDGAQPRRIWFITDDWFNADVQAQFHRLEQTHPLQFVAGDCTRAWCYLAQLMEAPPLAEPVRFGQHLGFVGADIDQADRQAVRLRLWWQAAAPIALDYSVGLHLLDESGALVAQFDGAILHYGVDIIPTSQMQVGRLYIDQRTLTPPEDSPPGTYTLALIVYQPWDGARLPLADGADQLVIGVIELP